MSFQSDDEETWEIEIESGVIANALAKNPQFIREIADAVRDQMIKDSRSIGDLFGPTAAQRKTPLAAQPQAPATQRVN